jgi:serine/threonine protein kinase
MIDKNQNMFYYLFYNLGQFGRVVGAIRKSTNRKVAIKCIEKANCSEDDIRRTNEEIVHLHKFNHVNSISFHQMIFI